MIKLARNQIAYTVAVSLLANALLPAGLVALNPLSAPTVAHAQEDGGQGGPMGFLMGLMGMFALLGGMKNNNLQGPPEEAQRNALMNLFQIPNSNNRGQPQQPQQIIIINNPPAPNKVPPNPNPLNLIKK